ncbi:MAG: hypothetical protein V7L25_01645 [Nostoc sp.]
MTAPIIWYNFHRIKLFLIFPTRDKVLNNSSISPLGLAVTRLGKLQDCTTSSGAKNPHFCILLPKN